MAHVGPAEVRERYGVEPKQVPHFIALRGDPSDKLPGARGVGAGRLVDENEVGTKFGVRSILFWVIPASDGAGCLND
jgi:hypothetical protein